MKLYFYKLFFLVAAICFATSSIASTDEHSADDPHSTAQAFRSLFSISNESIPKTSTCMGYYYGQRGRAKVKDLVSMILSYLYDGNNVIKGNCDIKYCVINITHDAGEDVSSADIKFAVKNGKAQAASLECVITP